MTRTDEPTTIRREIVVDVPREHAFRVFTERFDGIKPREYNLLPVDIAETVLEPRVGGEVYDRGVDGSVCRWARVLAFAPPERLVISWDIDTAWRPEADPERCSEVEIRFEPLDDERTRVLLEHRHLDRHGEGWPAYRDGVGSGWPRFLTNLAELTREAGAA